MCLETLALAMLRNEWRKMVCAEKVHIQSGATARALHDKEWIHAFESLQTEVREERWHMQA